MASVGRGRSESWRRCRVPTARNAESVESGQGSLLGAAPSGIGRAGCVRPHAGKSVPAHGAVPSLALGQATTRLHFRAARGGATSRARGHLRYTLGNGTADLV